MGQWLQDPRVRKMMKRQAFICLLLILLAAGMVYFLQSFSHQALSQVEMETVEDRMHLTVENVIRQIELYDRQKKAQYDAKLERNANMLKAYPGNAAAFVQEWLQGQGTGSEDMPVHVLLQRQDGTEVWKNYPGDEQPEAAAEYRLVRKDGLQIWFFVPQAVIDDAVKDEIYAYIHNQTYDKNDYVWVNEVLDYDGGDQYAIRRIHPNLKDTEGCYLSTNLEDSAGAHPYESELAGIREKGEIFQGYYFQNLSDGKMAKKYSYAKLYQPFDWIIATGIPEADIFELSEAVQAQQRMQMAWGCVLIFLLLFLLLASSTLLTKRGMELEIARNSAKSVLLSRASHDMRTPLNAIINFSNKEFTLEADEKKLRSYMDSINDSARYQLSLINDLLAMAKFEKNSFQLYPQPTQVIGCLLKVQQMMKLRMEEKRQHFEVTWTGVGEDDYVLIDSMRVEEILLNLLTNSTKFTGSGGHISCHLQAAAQGERCLSVVLSVKDDGVGIAPAQQKAIFEPFVQHVDAKSMEQTQGAGLGLSIVKELVHAMSGKIILQSEPGKGTLFQIHLLWPRCASVTDRKTHQGDYSELKGKHVLICEDNELNVLVLQGLLGHIGMISDTAENGKIGVEMFRVSAEGYYDAVLMDNLMPVMNGMTAAKEIRSLKRGDAGRVKIIAVSANAYAEDKQKALAAHMDGYVTKPIEPLELYDVLKQQLVPKQAEK